jgi:gliding motility-associated-like protein
MRHLYACLLLLSPVFFNQIAQAQTVQTVQFTPPVLRAPLHLKPGENWIRVGNLTPGRTYSFIPVAAFPEVKAQFKTTFANKKMEAVAQPLTPADRPQWRRMQVESTDVLLVVDMESDLEETPVSLSINCEDCPRSTLWMDKFKDAVESVNIQTTPGVSASSLITNTLIGGDCFEVSGITGTGNVNSRGTFSNGVASIGLPTGAVLCTGHVNIIPGPNNQQNANNGFGFNSPDDPDLATLSNGNQFDLSRIVFSFTPTSDLVQFDYVFASEEYCEFANTNYNDVFGFFISGPGINGTQNIALIPNSNTPITINNVNHVDNTQYYVNNNTWNPCQNVGAHSPNFNQFDGFTTVLTAVAELIPCETYQIKLAIADIADQAYASAVFLKANSFNAGGTIKSVPVYPSGQDFVYEGCNNGFIRFIRSGDLSQPFVVNYTVGGSATPGDDYDPLPTSVTIPANQSFVQIPVSVLADLIAEGIETITITLENACSCELQEMTFNIQDLDPLEVEMEDIYLCGNGPVTLGPTVEGGISPYTYLWSSGQTTSTISVNTPGITEYTVTVTDNCGATATASATVEIEPRPTATLTGSGVFCTNNFVPIDLTVTFTGTGPWTLEYNAAGNTVTETFTSSPAIITVEEPGAYNLIAVESSSGCTGTVSGNVNLQEITVNLTVTPQDPTCNGVNNGSIQSSASGGANPFTYQWDDGPTGPNRTNLGPGTYTVTVTNGQGCTETETVTLTQPDPLIVTITEDLPIDCNNASSSPTVDVSGGTPDYTFQWSNNSNQQNPVFTSGGTYTVTVTDDNNCTATATVTVPQNTTPPVATATFNGVLNCANPEMTINGTGSSQGPNFSYEWSGPSFVCCETTLEPVINQGGTYTLTVTNNDNGCTATASVTIPENTAQPVLTVNFTNPACNGSNNGSIQTSATGGTPPFTYQWDDGPTGPNRSNLGPGTYTVTVTNADGCTDEETITLEEPDPLVATITPDVQIDCNNATSNPTLDVSGGTPDYTFQWSNNSSQQNPSFSAGGTYTVTVTDDNNCTATASVTIPQNTTPPVATATAPGPVTCVTPEITINGLGSSQGPNFTYEWSGPSFVCCETTLEPVINQGGTYTLTVTNTDNGCTATASVTIQENTDNPVLTVNFTSPACNGSNNGSIQVSATGGTPPFTYQWDDGPTGPNRNNLPPGTYTVTVTNANGCSEVATVTLEEPDPLVATITPDVQIDCINSSSNPTLDVSGGTPNYTFQWSNNSNQQNPTFTTGGTYTVTVTDSKNCTTTASITIPQNTTPPVATATAPGPVNCTNPEITINGLGSSQGPNFTYEWSGPSFVCCETTLQPVINQGGTYSLTVTNTDNGCTATASVTIQENTTEPTVNLNAVNPGCNGSNNGTIQAAATGGNAPFTYVWADGPTGPNRTNLGPGTYTVTVTNADGCSAEASVTLEEPDPLTASITPDNPINCYTPTSNPTVEVEGGTPGYNYQWSNNANGPSPSFTTGGTYTVTVTDSKNCTTTATITIPQNNTPPIASANVIGQLTCLVTEITINGLGSSQGPEFTYEWSGPSFVCCETTLTPIVNEGGVYALTVTNSDNGCTATTSVTIVQNITPPNVNINTPAEINCNLPVVTLNGAGTSNGPGFSFTWSTVGGNFVCCTNTLTPQINQAGEYTLSVVNNVNGCTAETSVTVSGDVTPPVAAALPPGVVNCFEPEVTLDGSGSSEGPNFTYNWTGPSFVCCQNTLNPIVNAGGVYTLVVTNTDNNCTASVTVTVPQNTTPPIAVANVNGSINCQTPTITINGSGSSQGQNFSYEWTTQDGSIVSGENTLNPVVNAAGTYTLVVTNTVNGCTAQTSVTVNADQGVPFANAGPGFVLNCYTPTVTLQGSGSTGQGFSVQWTANPGNIVSGANTFSPTVNQPGLYFIVVSNAANGCTSQDAVEVTQNFNTPDAIIAAPGQITCYEPEIELDATPSTGENLAFQWFTVNGSIVSGANTPNPVINASGTYSLTVTDTESGCTNVASVVVTANTTAPVANAGSDGEIDCQNPTITLNGNGSSQGGNYVYLWETYNGSILCCETTLNPIVDQPGEYVLRVTNVNNGCTDEDEVTVTADQNLPIAVAGPDRVLDCLNPTVQLEGIYSSNGNGLVIQWTANPGNIVSGANTLSPVVNESGYYVLTISNPSNGCTAEDEVFVDFNIYYPTPVIEDPNDLNCTFESVELNAGGSFGVGNLDFSWSTPNGNIISGANSALPEVDEPGVYNVLIVDESNGCTATASVSVAEDVALPNAVAVSLDTLTCQFPQADLSGLGSSEGFQFFYQWTTTVGQILSGELTLSPVVALPGPYTLTVYNNDNGCTRSATVNVVSNAVFPTSNAGQPQTLNCAAQQVTLNGVASSQGPQYVYVWSTQNGNILSGANTLNPVVNAVGQYDLSVINTQTGCASTASVSVGINVALPLAVAAPADTLSCTQPSLALDGAGSSANGPFTYLWSTVNGNILSGDTTLQPVVNAAGAYMLLVTNTVNGCTAVATTTVNADNSLPLAAAGPNDTLDCVVAVLTLDGAASSQGSEFSYQWTGPGILSGVNTPIATVNQPGNYALVVTNTSNGCTATDVALVVDSRQLPVAEAGPEDIVNCYQPSLQINGAASSNGPEYTYSWTTADGNILSGANTLTPTVNQSGTYTLLVSNTANGCTNTDAVFINQNTAPPFAEAGAAGLLTCTEFTVTLAGSASTGSEFTYVWTTADGNIVAGDSILSPIVDAPGQYQLLVFNTLNGCTATDTTTVARDANVPIALAAVPGPLTCAVNQITLNGNASTQGPGVTYTWTTTNGNIVSGANTLSPVVNSPGQYQLMVFNANNNCQAQFTADVLLDIAPPTANAGAPLVLSCLSPQLVLNGNASSQGAAFNYSWTTLNGNILSGQNTLTPTVNKAGFYTLVVTNLQNGCTAASTVQVLLDQNTPVANAGAEKLLTCTATAVTLTGTGSSAGPNFSYQWSTTNGNIVSGANTTTPTVDAPGVYELFIVNALNGCTAAASVNVNIDTIAPPVAISPPVVLNCQTTQQALNAAVAGGGAGYSYAWTTAGGSILQGANTAQPAVNAPGAYNLLVTNLATGCTAQAATNVSQDIAKPDVAAGPTSVLTCLNTSATLSGTASNTGALFSIQWTTQTGNIVSGANTLNPVVNQPGAYTVIVQNQNNFCSDTATVTITQNTTAPIAVAGNPQTITCNTPVVQLSGVGSSSGPQFTYAWSTVNGNIVSGANTLLPLVNAAGAYILVVTNTQNGCTKSVQVQTPINITSPTAEAGPTALINCIQTTAQLNGAGSSIGSAFAYQWTSANGQIVSGAQTLTPIVGAGGTYQILVTNLTNGCTATASVEISADVAAPEAAAATPGELTCSTQTINLSGQGSSVGTQFTYQWSGAAIVSGGNTLTPLVSAPGTYQLVVTNTTNGCSQIALVPLTQNIAPPIANAGPQTLLTCTTSQIALSGAAAGGVNGVSTIWTASNGGNILSGQNTLAPQVNRAGTYTLLVTDLYNGCTSVSSVALSADQNLPLVAIAAPAELNCTVNAVTLQAGASSQGPAFQYAWSGPGLQSGANTLSPVVNLPGAYTLQITNADNGCTAQTSVSVPRDIQLPAVDAGPGFELTCSVEDGPLNASASAAAGNPLTYTWSTPDGRILSGANSLSAFVDQPGAYILVVTNLKNGCSATDQAIVTLNTNVPVGLNLLTDRPACGGKKGEIKFEAVQGGVGPYLYSIDGGQTFRAAEAFLNLSPGQYDLVVQDANGCEYAETLSFPVPVEPDVAVDPEISLAYGDSEKVRVLFNIPMNQVDTIIWTPDVGITRTNRMDEVILQPFRNTYYEVILINKDGCQDRAALLVRVDDPAIWAPNAFSPNHEDGNNDFFTIFARDNDIQVIRSLQVFDRWGNQVFYTENIPPNVPNLGWNGRFRGEPMNPAVFVWYAEVELLSGERIILKGDITIVD